MSKTYIYDTGTFVTLDCGSTITASTVHLINVQKPDATSTTWAASVSSSQYLTYTVSTADLTTAGRYMLQAYIELGTSKWRGETAELWVYDVFK